MVWRGPNMERVRITWSVGGYQEAAQKGSAEEPQLNHRHKPASTTCVALTIFPYLAFRTFLFNSSPRLCYISNSPSNILTITSTSFPSALVPSRLHSHSLGTHANTRTCFFLPGDPHSIPKFTSVRVEANAWRTLFLSMMTFRWSREHEPTKYFEQRQWNSVDSISLPNTSFMRDQSGARACFRENMAILRGEGDGGLGFRVGEKSVAFVSIAVSFLSTGVYVVTVTPGN